MRIHCTSCHLVMIVILYSAGYEKRVLGHKCPRCKNKTLRPWAKPWTKPRRGI